MMLQTDFTCPEMRDQCNSTECPQHTTCEHRQESLPAIDRAIINTTEHAKTLGYLLETMECVENTDGIIAILTLLHESVLHNVELLCEVKSSVDCA